MNEEAMSISERSVIQRGDISRIAFHMKRAMAGEPVRLGFMGGSITKGGCASTSSKGFAALVTAWWRENFPKADITAVNAGIPGTGSLIGVHRVDRDLLNYRPDFVCVEFAVNDFNPMLTETYDSMVRKILLSPALPGVMLLHMTNENGGGAEEQHSQTGFRYDLPMISFKRAVWPELEAGRMKWEDIEADTVHPNDRGHELIAQFITDRLAEILEFAKNNDVPAPQPSIAEPLNGDWYRDAQILQSNGLVPIAAKKWEITTHTPIFGPGWDTHTPNTPLIIELMCTNIGIIYNWAGTGKMGQLQAIVDDEPAVVINAHAEQKGAAAVRGIIIGKHMRYGRHRLKMKVMAEPPEGSDGHEFQICAILVS